jgi:hypothetical protein
MALSARKYRESQKNKKLARELELEEDEEKPVLPVQSLTKELISVSKDVFKDEDGKHPKVLDIAERVEPYMPVIGQFFKGLVQGMQNNQVQNAQQKAARPSIQPPAGWESFSPIQRLAKKYASDGTESVWYAQGIAWEEYKASGIQPSVTVQQVQQGVPASYNEPQNLRQLARKYPEAPLVSDELPVQTPIPSDPSREGKPVGFLSSPQENNKSDTVLEETMKAIQDDQVKYVNMAISYLDTMPMEQFKQYLSDLDSWITKALTFKFMLPVHLKAIILATPADELIQVLEKGCVEKYKWLKENNQLEAIKKKYDELRSKL